MQRRAALMALAAAPAGFASPSAGQPGPARPLDRPAAPATCGCCAAAKPANWTTAGLAAATPGPAGLPGELEQPSAPAQFQAAGRATAQMAFLDQRLQRLHRRADPDAATRSLAFHQRAGQRCCSSPWQRRLGAAVGGHAEPRRHRARALAPGVQGCAHPLRRGTAPAWAAPCCAKRLTRANAAASPAGRSKTERFLRDRSAQPGGRWAVLRVSKIFDWFERRLPPPACARLAGRPARKPGLSEQPRPSKPPSAAERLAQVRFLDYDWATSTTPDELTAVHRHPGSERSRALACAAGQHCSRCARGGWGTGGGGRRWLHATAADDPCARPLVDVPWWPPRAAAPAR